MVQDPLTSKAPATAGWVLSWVNWACGSINAPLVSRVSALEKRVKALEDWRVSVTPKPPVALRINVFCVLLLTRNSKGTMMASTLQMTDIQQAVLSVQEVDAAGNPTTVPLDSPPVWNVSDTTVLTITPSANGMSATIVSTGKLGTSQVSVTAPVAGKPLSGSLDVTVVASAAASLNISAGTPTP